MSRRILIASALAGTLAIGLAAAPAASGGNVGWSVSIGAPGVVVNAGAPAYGYWGPAYRPYYPRYRPVYVAPPVVYPAPVYYAPPYRVVAPRPYYGPYYRPYRY
jgi:hypothetical protein